MRSFPAMLAVLTLGVASLFAEDPPAPVKPSLDDAFFAGRRTELAKRVEDGVIVVRSAPKTTAGVFRQGNDFYYLTGIEKPDLILIIVADDGTTYVFGDIGESDSRGIGKPRKASEFDGVMAGLAKPGRAIRVPSQTETGKSTSLDPAGDPRNRPESRKEHPPSDPDFAESLKRRFKDCKVNDLNPVLSDMRRVKTEQELRMIEEACSMTSRSIKDCLPLFRPGMYEHEASAKLKACFRDGGATGAAFSLIVAAGRNALTIHYAGDKGRLKTGELLLMDVGAEYGYYAADVTRTVPISGKLTDEQRSFYESVLKAQEAAIAAVKPGATMADVDAAATRVLTEAKLDKHIAHFTCHYVGMSVHDPGEIQKPFEEGVVITVEPGIYVQGKGIGIRIEDTVVVTKDGCRVLTAGAPKRPDDIEAAMKHE
jgi:Xaa-Pro aminopeptidase